MHFFNVLHRFYLIWIFFNDLKGYARGLALDDELERGPLRKRSYAGWRADCTGHRD